MEQDRSRHFVRCDAVRNMNRFYRLTVTRDLFGTVVLLREWGRIGTYCRRRFDEKRSSEEARLARQKLRRGYIAVPE